MITDIFLPCLYSFVACIGFCIVFNLRGWVMVFSALGGALSWLVYLLCGTVQNDIFQYFIATVVVSIYAELMARIQKRPVTCYLIVAILPLVPGGGIYATMEYCINGENQAFLKTGLHTLAIAGSLAVGILVVSSAVHLWHRVHLSMRARGQG